MKKILAIILILLVLCGCSANPQQSLPTTEQSTTEVPSDILDSESLYSVLDAIADTRPGTAGASLRSTAAAVELLNWTEKNTANKEQLSTALNEYFAAMSYDDIALFAQCFVSVDSVACDILSNADYVSGMISDSNSAPDFDSYTTEKYELFCSAISEYLTIGHQ